MSKEKLFVKYIRAKSKTTYHKSKKSECYVCGSVEKLEQHHIIPLSSIVHGYLKEHGIVNPSNDSELREEILKECTAEIFNEENLVTLCKVHHKNLHSLFGKTYPKQLAPKVSKFLTSQKEKMEKRRG